MFVCALIAKSMALAKTTTKSPSSIASILLPQTTKDTPTLDLPSKADDKEALLHLEQSLSQ